MIRLIGLLLLVAAVGGGACLTRPTEAMMKAEADATFASARRQQVKDFDLGALAKGAVDGLTRKTTYEDFQVAARYAVMDGDKEVLSCWGAYTRVMCPELKEAR
jgi:hypothetical protein